MSKIQVVNEIHKAARRNFIRRSVVLKGIDDLWQADLIDFVNLKSFNHGYKFILVVLDCFSKFAWAIPVKTKTKCEIANAFNNILFSTQRKPANLQTDLGTEFYNNEFKKITTLYKINHYSTYSIKKASIVERLIKTLKNKLYKSFSLSGSYKWVGKPLENVVDLYNDTIHRITKHKPNVVNHTNQNLVMKNIKKSQIKTDKSKKTKLNIGDLVRISKYKGSFEKGYTPNWSTELFLIKKVNHTNPFTYVVEDLHKQPILGTFYEPELQKTNSSNVYLIERVIRKKGSKLFVKWLGLSESENSWIEKRALL